MRSPPRCGARRCGARRCGARRCGARRRPPTPTTIADVEPADLEPADLERAGAERAGAERAGAERAGAERAGAERAGAEPTDEPTPLCTRASAPVPLDPRLCTRAPTGPLCASGPARPCTRASGLVRLWTRPPLDPRLSGPAPLWCGASEHTCFQVPGGGGVRRAGHVIAGTSVLSALKRYLKRWLHRHAVVFAVVFGVNFPLHSRVTHVAIVK